MKMIVGLGNPGLRYQHTRHNVGFRVIDHLIQSHGLAEPKKQFEGLVTEWCVSATKSLLVKPQTFMNLSGRCVRRFVDFYKIEIGDILVVSDDLDLKLGQVRLRASGSSGGQRGLRDIIQHLGSESVARLRIGIDRPPELMQAADYVLQDFAGSEKSKFERLLVDVGDGLQVWIRDGVVPAMNRLNQARNYSS